MYMTAENHDELIALTTRFSGKLSVNETAIPQLKIARSDHPTEPVHAVYKPTLCFIVQGEKRTMIGDTILTYSPSQYLVASVDLPATGQVTKATPKNPYLCLVIDIDPTVVYQILKDSDQMTEQSSGARSGVYVAKSNEDLADAALRLVRCLKSKEDIAILAPLILKEITYRLLNSKFSETVRQLGIAGSQVQRISKSIEILKTQFAKPISVDELAKAANMSLSTFHLHFKQATTMSPLQYQKQMRLQEARRLLSTSASDIASTSFQVGYESPSQFSREYARLFGVSPSQDIKRLRTLAG